LAALPPREPSTHQAHPAVGLWYVLGHGEEARRGWVPPDLAPLEAARLEAPVDAAQGAT